MKSFWKTLRRLFSHSNINVVDEMGLTALMRAAGEGNVSEVQNCIDLGADINMKDGDGWTALMFAAMKGHSPVVSILVQAGANIEASDRYGSTALFYAAQKGNLSTVKTLLDNGAHPEAKSNDGSTPLSTASAGGHTEIVNLIRNAKASGHETLKSTKRVLIHLGIQDQPNNFSEIVQEAIRIYRARYEFAPDTRISTSFGPADGMDEAVATGVISDGLMLFATMRAQASGIQGKIEVTAFRSLGIAGFFIAEIQPLDKAQEAPQQTDREL